MAIQSRKPNHDANGRPLAGKEINFDATTGDLIVMRGLTYKVMDTNPEGVSYVRANGDSAERNFVSYSELKRRGAFYAAV